MFIFEKEYRASFIASAIAHVVLFLFLFTSVSLNSSLPYVVKSGLAPTPIVHAVAVNQQQVQQAVDKLHEEQLAHERAEAEHIKQLQQQAANAKAEQEAAYQHLQQLKAQQQTQKAQQQLQQEQAAAKLAALKQQQLNQQQQAATKLAALKQQQVAQQQKLAQLQNAQQLAAKNYQAQQEKLATLKKQQLTMSKQNMQSQDAKDLLAQQLQEEQIQLNQAKAAYIQGIVNKYNALVLQAIYQNWFIPPNTNPKLGVKLQVNVAPGGAVSNVSVLDSSGDKALDQSATMAVYKASPLPIPTNNPNVYKQFQQFSITMTPSESTEAAG